MALPFELTTLPRGALDIIRFLHRQDTFAAFDGEIMDATGLSERGFGKALRRLVTREYVEMQYDGSYALTEQGMEAADTIAAEDESAQAESSFEDSAPEPAPEPEFEPEPVYESVTRSALVISSSHFAAGSPGFLFIRVDDAAAGTETPVPVDMLFRVTGECEVFPEQGDTTIPEQGKVEPVRFELTPGAAGEFIVRVEAFHVTQADLALAGSTTLTLTAIDGQLADTYRLEKFTLTFQPGL